MEKDTFIGFVSSFTLGIAVLVAAHQSPKVKMVEEELPLNIIDIKRGYAIHPLKHRKLMERDVECKSNPACLALAEAIYYEARGEPLHGQIAIGWVIINRKISTKFKATTVREVIAHKCQFSYRCDGSMSKGFADKQAYDKALYVAENIRKGVFADPTNGADHYLNPRKVKRMPKWTQVYPMVASIGNHDFYVWK